jgi:hypothetical protein
LKKANLVHFDMHEENVLVSDSPQRMKAVLIDFESCTLKLGDNGGALVHPKSCTRRVCDTVATVDIDRKWTLALLLWCLWGVEYTDFEFRKELGQKAEEESIISNITGYLISNPIA